MANKYFPNRTVVIPSQGYDHIRPRIETIAETSPQALQANVNAFLNSLDSHPDPRVIGHHVIEIQTIYTPQDKYVAIVSYGLIYTAA